MAPIDTASTIRSIATHSSRRLVWALDPFGEGEDVQRVVPYLKALSEVPVEILPVYILGPGSVNFPIGAAADNWLESYEPAAEDRMREVLAGVQVPGLLDPEVMVEPQTTLTQAVAKLVDRARAFGAESIVVSSNPRSGVSRILLGSFTETILSESDLPVLMVGPNTVARARIATILFPTNFGPRSKRVFRRVAHEALALGAHLILYHAVPQPIEPLLESGAALLGGSWVPVQPFFSDDLERHRRRTEAWACWARNQGVDAETVMDQFGGSIAEAILRLTESRSVDLVAMETHSGALTSALIGSIVKQVIRSAPVPVWVIRTFERGVRKTPRGTESTRAA